MTVETYLLMQDPVNWIYVAFVFTSTLVLYNFPTFTEANFLPEYSERHRWITENKNVVLAISIVAALASAILIFFFPLKFILWFVPLALIALAYFFPQTHLRRIAGLKAGVVTLVWTSVTAIYPLLLLSGFDVPRCFENESGMIMLLNFLFIFPLCVIYNVRDVEADRKAGVRTLPVIYGVKITVLVCLISLALFSWLVIITIADPEIRACFLFSAAATSALLLFASEKRSDYFYSFWIDGMILLQALLLMAVFAL
jgi:4-hydroxybenzoate polyprenyltransferase